MLQIKTLYINMIQKHGEEMQNANNSFAERLNRLFEEKRKPNGDRHAKKEVIESSPALSRLILWRLETGQTLKPSYEVVKALADFFGVQPGYFFEEDEEIKIDEIEPDREKQLETLLKSFGVAEEGRKALRAMIDVLKSK